MVLDLDLFKDEQRIKLVKESQKRRFKDVSLVDKVVEIQEQWKKLRQKVDNFNRLQNLCTKAFGDKKKAKEPEGTNDPIPQALIDKISDLTIEDFRALSLNQIKALKLKYEELRNEADVQRADLEKSRLEVLAQIGNLVEENVPVSDDENNNGIVRTFGDCTSTKKYSHVDLVVMVDGVELEIGAKVAGNRGYYLKGPLVLLEAALIQYSLHLMYPRGYTPLYTPFFMRKEIMQEVAQLSQFDEELYKVVGKASELAEDKTVEEKYLIATSEQPIAALHRSQSMEPKDLPKRYLGVSTCFRQEVGSHGRDTTGIFRVHQFEKVEQFTITTPKGNASWEMHDEMIKNAEDFCQGLGIPYRIINIVTGALNLAAAKKLDLEAWFPSGQGTFRELVSASNCTDYQARRLNVKFGYATQADQKTEFVHMLNATLCATTRVLCVLLELYQTENGVVVPPALRPFLPPGFPKVIPFVKKAPIDIANEKKKQPATKGKK